MSARKLLTWTGAAIGAVILTVLMFTHQLGGLVLGITVIPVIPSIVWMIRDEHRLRRARWDDDEFEQWRNG